MKLKIDREWCLNAAKREAEYGGECGAGMMARDPSPDTWWRRLLTRLFSIVQR